VRRQLEDQVTAEGSAADLFAEAYADDDPEHLVGLTVGLVNLSQLLLRELSEMTRQPPTKLLTVIAAGLEPAD
jgi:hypothetical protein